jgi:hypothetical protein
MDGYIDPVNLVPPQKNNTALILFLVVVIALAVGAGSYFFMLWQNGSVSTTTQENPTSPYQLTAVIIPESARGEMVTVKEGGTFPKSWIDMLTPNSSPGTPAQAVPPTSIHNPPPAIGELGQPAPVLQQL